MGNLLRQLLIFMILLVSGAELHAAALDISVTDEMSLSDAINQKTSNPESVTILTVHGSIYRSDLSALQQLTNLEMLDLSDTRLDVFGDCYMLTKLRRIVLGETTKTLDPAACMMCSALTEIVMPAVEEIGFGAFMGCSALKSINLPAVLTKVGENIFQDCTALTDIYCYVSDYQGTLLTEGQQGVKLHVHRSLVEHFQQKEEYATVIAMDFMFPSLLLSQPTTLKDISAYQGTNVAFKMSETMNTETYRFLYFMGALNLDAPASPKWQVGRLTLPVDYYSYQTNHDFDDNGNESYEDIYAIASFVNQRTVAEAETVEVRLKALDGEEGGTFFSVPFDVNVNDIHTPNGKCVIYRYAGENRATLKSGETWVEVKPGEQLHAFEGYLFRIADRRGYDDESYDEIEDDLVITLPAADTRNKQNVFAAGDVVVPLKKHAAARPHNADWNLVGNPYPCYFELSGIKEHVDVCFYKNADEGFVSVNTADGKGIFLAPGMTFFVQATNVEQLTFQSSGRRLQAPFGELEAAIQMDPAANFFNPSTKEAYFDLFVPGNLSDAERVLLHEDGMEQVLTLTVAAPISERDLFFSGFAAIKRIDLGQSSGFTTVPTWAFAYLEALQEVVLPACVTRIADDAFMMNLSLEQLTIYATTPPKVSSKTFSSLNKENLVVLVPQEAVAAYKTATGWKELNVHPIGGGGEELQNVAICVLTPDGEDITEKCNILWRDADGNQLGLGQQLEAQAAGTAVNYSVTLPVALASLYEAVPEGQVTVRASGNLITIELTATGVENLGTRELRGSMGTIDFTLQSAEPERRAALELADVLLTIRDKQTGAELTDFLLQYPELQFEQTRLQAGQVVIITAASRDGHFETAQVEVMVNADGDFESALILKERGHARITCTGDADASHFDAFVFDAQGHYVNRFLSSGNVITIKDLGDGDYTAVVMEESQFFGVVASLADLAQTQLREGTDFARVNIQLAAGTTTDYTAEVPELDESRLCHTSSMSYITTNDPAITSVNTATLKTKVVFKEEYAAAVSNLRLIITFPEGTDYVENSLMMTQGNGSHQYANRRLIIPCQAGEQVRFCLEATTAGKKAVSAMVQYNLNGKQYTQPIGAATVEVQNQSLDICEITDSPMMTVEGYLMPSSQVVIYDGTNKVAEYTTDIYGYLRTDITLNPAFSGTYHQIYATYQKDNIIRTTETSTVYLDNSASSLTEISMIYQGQCLTWHMQGGSLVPDYYSVNPSISGLTTFVAKLNNPQPENILGPEFYVIASDGTERVIPATWDEAQQAYTATSDYPDTKRLPVQPYFIYDYANPTPPEREDIFNEEANYIQQLHNQLATDVDDLIHFGDVVTDETDEVAVNFNVANDPTIFRMTVRMEDYDAIDALRSKQTFSHTRLGNDSIATCVDGNESYVIVHTLDFTNHYAYSLTIALESSASTPAQVRRRGLGTVLGKLMVVQKIGDLIDKARGIYQDGKDLMWSKVYLDQMVKMRNNHQSSLSNQTGHCHFVLYAMCSDNTYRIPGDLLLNFQRQIAGCEAKNDEFINKLDALIQSYKEAVRNRIALEYVSALATAGAGKFAKFALSKGYDLIWKVSKTGLGTFAEIGSFIENSSAGAMVNLAQEVYKKHLPTDFMGVKKQFEQFAPEGWSVCAARNLALADNIQASYKKCEKDPGEIDRPRRKVKQGRRRSRPIIDPSGFVYEGVESNRLEGVTATIYYKENESADEEFWNAEAFGQQNPQVTDVEGLYMWNVPKGLWQVRFEKEGYHEATTEWLPVPPPQLEIAVSMTPEARPVVESVTAYADAVSIHFSQYMRLASLAGISLKQNGAVVQGELKPTDAEGELVRALRFVPRQPLTAKTVLLTVPVAATSHTGRTLSSEYAATLEVQHTIEGLIVQEATAIQMGSVGYVSVTAYPAVAVAGKALSIDCNSPLVALEEETVLFDDNGQANVPFRGLLPGEANVAFTIGDLSAKATVAVKFSLTERCARPVATVAEGPVQAGTTIELISATEGAIIYYTTDGSCPCDEDSRKRYTGPITILTDMTIQALAVSEGMAESEVTTLTYSITTPVEAPEAEPDTEAEDLFYDLSGARQLPPLRRGVYIHIRRTPNGTVSRKIRIGN